MNIKYEYLYDINNNECKTLSPLPFAVTNMATVSYKGNVVLIEGVNEKEETLNTVAMYDIKISTQWYHFSAR